MAHIVKQSRRPRSSAIFLIDIVLFAQAVQHARHEVERAERVGKSGVLRALISVETQSELLDSPQPLKFRRVNQAHHQLAFVRVGAKTDDVVNRIAIDAF